jgi:putative flippase GtrA
MNHTKKILNNKITHFFLVSGVNTVFGYGLFALLIYIGLHYTLALLITTVISLLFNFKTIGVLVFKNKKNELIINFIGVSVIRYFLTVIFMAIFKYYGINEYISQAILIIPMGLLGYVLNHYFVFNEKNNLKLEIFKKDCQTNESD